MNATPILNRSRRARKPPCNLSSREPLKSHMRRVFNNGTTIHSYSDLQPMLVHPRDV
jgi:hypothetical protein